MREGRHQAVMHKNVGKPCFEDVQKLLKLAVRLELFTIPVYLYTYFSLEKNSHVGNHVGNHLREVMMEEMQHMAIISNIMHALKDCTPPAYSPIMEIDGGERCTDALIRKYVPFYPGPVPIYKHKDDRGEAGDHRRFISDPRKKRSISLDCLSRDQIVTLLRLELPDLNKKNDPKKWKTIGEFYEYVKQQLLGCSKLEFIPSEQINLYTHNPTKEKNAIKSIGSLKDALDSIDYIVEQGEGATFYNLSKNEEKYYHLHANPEEQKAELAHFYHFLIVYELMGGEAKFTVSTQEFKDDEFRQSFNPKKYKQFQKDNVINLVKDPSKKLRQYPPDAVKANHHFNSSYSKLLDALTYGSMGSHRLNFGIALEQMSQFDKLAGNVTKFALTNDSTTFCGPTFQYIEPNERS